MKASFLLRELFANQSLQWQPVLQRRKFKVEALQRLPCCRLLLAGAFPHFPKIPDFNLAEVPTRALVQQPPEDVQALHQEEEEQLCQARDLRQLRILRKARSK